jgi:hypothetical protein
MLIAQSDAMLQQCPAANRQQLLRPIGTHAGALTSGDDDCGNVHLFILPFGTVRLAAHRATELVDALFGQYPRAVGYRVGRTRR